MRRGTGAIGAKRHGWVVAALLILQGLTAPPPAPAVSPALKSAINAQVRAARRVSREISVQITEVESGEHVYGYNADEPRVIASNTKLFTTAAALDALGPGHFIETHLLARTRRENGAEGGAVRDLAVLGAGDPNISGRHFQGDSYAVFRAWAEALRRRGIRRVEGDLYLVHGLFEGRTVHPDWPRDQLSRWYEAPVDALSFNDNCVLVRVWPSSHPGRAPRVETVPRLSIFRVTNTATTSGSRRGNLIIDREIGANHIRVRGSIYRHSEPAELWISVEDPVQYFAVALRDALAEEGIAVAGRLLRATALPGEWTDWRPVATHRSDLFTTIEVIHKRSQNFYAESLLKVLGARLCGEGSWAAGVRAVSEFLDRVGLERGTYSLADGSGMSRNNRFTARQLTLLLRFMAAHRWRREFMRSLPYSGEEGLRWERRLAEAPYAGNVFAKTGTLNGVSALSGYAKGRSGTLYAFSILCNRNRSNWEAVRAQDQILRALIANG